MEEGRFVDAGRLLPVLPASIAPRNGNGHGNGHDHDNGHDHPVAGGSGAGQAHVK
jgi:hypothetical protein